MTYFSLRKRVPEPEPEAVEEDLGEMADEEPEQQPSANAHGPILTGLLGPGSWIAARSGAGAAWGVHAVGVWVIGYYGGWLAVGVALVWLLAVLLFIPKESLDRATAWIERRFNSPSAGSETVDEEPDEPAEETPAGPDPADVVDLVRDVIGDDRGALLTALRGPLRATDTRAVREVLAGAGVRVRPGVRTGRGNGPGVHRDDLPPVSPSPDRAPVESVPAGGGANNNSANTIRVQSREGMTIINDPADRHRTHTLHKP